MGEWTSMIDNVSNDQTNERIIDPTIIDRELSPNPSQEEVKRIICEKDWVTYECRVNNFKNKPKVIQLKVT